MEGFANAVQTTLNGAIDNSQTSITVTSSSNFPATPFRVRIKAEGANSSEICTVTNVSGTTWTVTRASEAYAGSSSASAHGNGALVEHVLTAGGINAIWGRDLGVISLLQRPLYVNSTDDLFDASALDGKWTQIAGSSSLTELPGWLAMSASGSYIQQAVPGGDWSIETETIIKSTTSSTAQKAGLWLSNSATSTGTQKYFWVRFNGTGSTWDMGLETYVNGSFNASIATTSIPSYIGRWFLRIRKSSSTYSFDLSANNIGWYQWTSTGSLGITPTYYGLRTDATNGAYYNYFIQR